MSADVSYLVRGGKKAENGVASIDWLHKLC